jgi:hypothetical protein
MNNRSIQTTSIYSPSNERSQISYHVLDSQLGFVNNRRCRCPPCPWRQPLLLTHQLCTLTNILSRVRLAAGVCEQPADVDALPAPGDNLSYSLTSFLRSQISYHVLDSQLGFVNNRPMSMPSLPLETTSPTHSPALYAHKYPITC